MASRQTWRRMASHTREIGLRNAAEPSCERAKQSMLHVAIEGLLRCDRNDEKKESNILRRNSNRRYGATGFTGSSSRNLDANYKSDSTWKWAMAGAQGQARFRPRRDRRRRYTVIVPMPAIRPLKRWWIRPIRDQPSRPYQFTARALRLVASGTDYRSLRRAAWMREMIDKHEAGRKRAARHRVFVRVDSVRRAGAFYVARKQAGVRHAACASRAGAR